MISTVKTPTRTAAPIIPYRKMGEIDYDSLDFDPHESVEKPDAMRQHREQVAAFNFLDARFLEFGDRPDVFMDFDSNICYDPNDLRRHVSPDVYIVFGVDAEAILDRLIYLPWEAGKPPDFVMEIASPTTARVDVERKPAIYESIGAPEFWMHDPSGGCFYGAPLRGRKLVNGKYQDIELTTEPDGILKGYSEVLGLSLAWDNGFLRLYDHDSGRYLERTKETAERADAQEARADAQEERADTEKERADTQEARAVSAEAQLGVTELQLQSEVRAREAAESRLESESSAREAAEAEIRRLREIIRRAENR